MSFSVIADCIISSSTLLSLPHFANLHNVCSALGRHNLCAIPISATQMLIVWLVFALVLVALVHHRIKCHFQP
jgi:hypothetical protein